MESFFGVTSNRFHNNRLSAEVQFLTRYKALATWCLGCEPWYISIRSIQRRFKLGWWVMFNTLTVSTATMGVQLDIEVPSEHC